MKLQRSFTKFCLSAALLGTLSIALTPAVSFATGRTCESIFRVPTMDLAQLETSHYNSPNVKAYTALRILRQVWPQFNNNANLQNALMDVLKDERLSSFHESLERILKKTSDAAVSQTSEAARAQTFKLTWTEELSRFMPTPEAQERVRLLSSSELNKQIIMKALGQMTAEETRVALVGPNGIRNVSADSLVGRYLQLAAAAGRNVSTYVGEFTGGPNGAGRGEPRLFVSVDVATAKLADAIFGQNPHFLIHNHSSRQGTLNMHIGGRQLYYASLSDGPVTLGYRQYEGYEPSLYTGTIAPLIVLSSTEASNVLNYGFLGQLTNQARAKYPWSFWREENGQRINYCRTGAYRSCTHWIGEMPVGDEIVREISTPGNNGDDPYTSHGASDDRTPGLRTTRIGTYTHFSSNSSMAEIGMESRVDRLTRMVWGQEGGHAQLWKVLGDMSAQLNRGEFANPGWVLLSLLGPARASRVPVVLVYRENASAPLDRAAIEALSVHIDPH